MSDKDDGEDRHYFKLNVNIRGTERQKKIDAEGKHRLESNVDTRRTD